MVVLLAAALLLVPAPAAARVAVTTAEGSRTLVGAGDIAVCGTNWDAATAALVNGVLAAVAGSIAFTAGDNVYPDGSSIYYSDCYAPTWGTFRLRTRPVPGNHDYYNNPTAGGYFGYFGGQAGPAARGWYKFDVGAWRVYSLTSECAQATTCFRSQYNWLKSDLATDPHQCALAIWHRPRFSSGVEHGSSTRMGPIFQLLYYNGAEIVINGHEHNYERFAPTDPAGVVNAAHGVRQWVVGTGGASLYGFAAALPASEVRNATSHGVLKLDLKAGSYDWQFLPVAGDTFTDSGSGTCH